jgi:hypothetical protein
MPQSIAKRALNNKADISIRLRPRISPNVPQIYPPNIMPKNGIELKIPLSLYKKMNIKHES